MPPSKRDWKRKLTAKHVPTRHEIWRDELIEKYLAGEKEQALEEALKNGKKVNEWHLKKWSEDFYIPVNSENPDNFLQAYPLILTHIFASWGEQWLPELDEKIFGPSLGAKHNSIHLLLRMASVCNIRREETLRKFRERMSRFYPEELEIITYELQFIPDHPISRDIIESNLEKHKGEPSNFLDFAQMIVPGFSSTLRNYLPDLERIFNSASQIVGSLTHIYPFLDRSEYGEESPYAYPWEFPEEPELKAVEHKLVAANLLIQLHSAGQDVLDYLKAIRDYSPYPNHWEYAENTLLSA